MKSILVATLLLSTPVFANQIVKITSFRRVDFQNFRNESAEVCGLVSGAITGNERVLLVSDSGTSSAREYVSLVSPRGQFCHVIATMYGRVTADLVGSSGPFSTEIYRLK